MSSIILDCGTGVVKAGFAGDDAPSSVFPTVVGHPKHSPTPMVATNSTCDYFVGSEAQWNRGMLDMRSPIQHGVVTDWDDMEKIWDHVFRRELRVEPEQNQVLLTEPPLNPKQNKERTAQIMFEKFGCAGIYFGMQSVMALYSYGLSTGLVVDSGEGVTQLVPIFDGFSLPHAVTRLDVAGVELTDYLTKLLNDSTGYEFVTSAEREIVRDIKEKLCFVAGDPVREMRDNAVRNNLKKQYTLPDGQTLNVNNERFQCPEVLFNPFLMGNQAPGLHLACVESVMKCGIDLRSELYKNIILVGGTTKLPGLNRRLEQEVNNATPKLARVRVNAAPERQHSVWIGGSIFASLITYGSKVWTTKQMYDEYGPEAVHGNNDVRFFNNV